MAPDIDALTDHEREAFWITTAGRGAKWAWRKTTHCVSKFREIAIRDRRLPRLDMNDAKSPGAEIAPAPIEFQGLSSGDELYRSAEEFRVLFELCPIATYLIDAAGAIVKFNELATKLWGREPVLGDTDEKFCGSHQMYLLDGTPLRHDECPMAQVVSGAIAMATDEQVVIERPDGSRVTVIVNIRPLRGSQGEIVGAINCFYEMAHPISVPPFAISQSPA